MNNEFTFIDEEISVPSIHLNRELKRNIYRILSARIGSATKGRGIIEEISPDIDLLDSRISVADSNNYFRVRYGYRSFKPVVGQVYTGSIVVVYEEGLFADMIKFHTLGIGGVYTKPDSYRFECCNANHTIGQNVALELTDVDFKDTSFFCVGKHVCE